MLQPLLLWNRKRRRFEWDGEARLSHHPRQAGFRWDGIGGLWFTDNPRDAALLVEFATPEAREQCAGWTPTPPHPLLDWSDERSRYEGTGPRSRNDVWQDAGFRWDSSQYLWWTTDADDAWKAAAFGSPETRARLQAAVDQRQALREASRAASADVELPRPAGLDYFPFQKAGIVQGRRLLQMGKRGVLLGDDMGLGKAQPLWSKVLTPRGWKLMGDLHPGDQVIGADGRPHTITGVYPQGTREVFKVTFSDGSVTHCCDDHLWAVNTPVRRKRGNALQVLPLRTLREKLHDKNGNRNHFIPLVKPVEFSVGAPLTLAPYLVGALLGDGGLRQRVVFSTEDPELVERIRGLLPDGCQIVHLNGCDWQITGAGSGRPNAVLSELRVLCMMGRRSCEKSIPSNYLHATTSDRLELLKGLLDTDGTVTNQGYVEFYTTSERLAADVRFLVQSLGGTCRVRTKSTKSLLCYRLWISLPPDVNPFWLPRKANAYRPKTKYGPSRSIQSVESIGEQECQCIAVDAPDHLYVTDDFILTHNTCQALGLVNCDPSVRSVLVIVPASLKINWYREARRWLLRPSLMGVCATSRPKTLFTGVEYVLPGESGLYDFLIINYDILPQFEADLRERTWDLLVLDECHYVKDKDALRSRHVYGWKPGRKAKSEWTKAAQKALAAGEEPPPEPREILPIPARQAALLTGTPIVNRPKELWPLIRYCDPETWNNEWNYLTRYCEGKSGRYGQSWDGAQNLEELQDKLRTSCFTGDTLVSSEYGPIAISEVVRKRLPLRVWSADPLGRVSLQPVVGYSAKPHRGVLVRVVHENGEFTCTPEHLIHTHQGYVRAGSLTPGCILSAMRCDVSEAGEALSDLQVLLSGVFGESASRECGSYPEDGRYEGCETRPGHREDLPPLPEGIPSEEPAVAPGSDLLLSKLPQRAQVCDPQGEPPTAECRCREASRSVETGAPTTARVPSSQGPEASGNTDRCHAGRSEVELGEAQEGRVRHHSPAGHQHQGSIESETWSGACRPDGTTGIPRGVGGISHPERNTDLLRGHCSSPIQNRNRDRRADTCPSRPAKEGQGTGAHLCGSRVRHVEVLALGDRGNPGRGFLESEPVYDIEVEGNHNFFANGILVHNCLIRRRKADVLKELPPKTYQVIEIPAGSLERLVLQEQSQERENAANLEELRLAVERAKASPDPEVYKRAVDQLKEGVGVAFQLMAKIRKETAVAKLPLVIEHLHEALRDERKGRKWTPGAEPEPIIAFAYHKEVFAGLEAEFTGRHAVVHGGIPVGEARQRQVDLFQGGERDLFLGSVVAAAEGLTLTRAAQVVFAELEWRPAKIMQSEDRAHRIGQKRGVLVQFLVLEGSIEARMAKALVEKMRVIEAALDNPYPVEELELPPLAAELSDPRTPPVPGTRSNVGAATSTTDWKRIQSEARGLPPEQIAAVHQGLKLLAGRCNWAQSHDGAGFNRLDVKLGHELASLKGLTAQQAILGKKILFRYRHTQLEHIAPHVTSIIWPEDNEFCPPPPPRTVY